MIYYQGIKGAYSYFVAEMVAEKMGMDLEKEVVGLESFRDVWAQIGDSDIGIIAVENSYAGSVHENFYNFLRYPDIKIIGEINLSINHSLLSKDTDIQNIKKVYAHPQALAQCYSFLKEHNMEAITYSDNASAAKYVSEIGESGKAAIASKKAGGIYGLNILAEGIEDQEGNTTRFFLIVKENFTKSLFEKKTKTTIIFETEDIPSALYKCLGAFATNHINLKKIESLPSLKNPFTYTFWVDFEGNMDNENTKKAMKELKFFTRFLKVLGEY
ncbi:MAG: prephenate dehydratase domain-containing protein [Candidatus Gracilibacteria bacterium]|nr:prephenate dehydratase domain-containing protein [Candidatus Gracilibacteria bacterium]MDD3119931.1 prephenate dehydratase domain-containing protein [Candidatus Gracilibacteria bacterium]MDD4530680.1 prephenate dehydratase domain-containing protein [Candidatus Gracilibacteria bacterium]